MKFAILAFGMQSVALFAAAQDMNFDNVASQADTCPGGVAKSILDLMYNDSGPGNWRSLVPAEFVQKADSLRGWVIPESWATKVADILAGRSMTPNLDDPRIGVLLHTAQKIYIDGRDAADFASFSDANQSYSHDTYIPNTTCFVNASIDHGWAKGVNDNDLEEADKIEFVPI